MPKGTRREVVAFQERLSVESEGVFMEAKCGIPPVNIGEQFGSVIINSKTIRNVKHPTFMRIL